VNKKSNSINQKAKWLEIVGLICLLLASFWQLFVVSKFEENFVDSHDYVVEEIFRDILAGQEDIAKLSVIDSLEKRYKYVNNILSRSGNRRVQIIQDRDDNSNIWKAGAEKSKIIRVSIFFIGTILIIYSKYLEIKSLQLE